MIKSFRSLICSSLILAIIPSAVVVTQAQTAPPPPPPPASYYRENTDDEKGSLVRGRAFYQDTAAPVRRGWISLTKIRDLVEKQETKETRAVTGVGNYATESSISSGTYVLTNDEGEFVVRNVKAGIYQATFKVPGILNPTFADRDNPLYTQITIDGINEIAVQISARRGGSVSGRITYSEGEPVIGARVEITRKKEAGKTIRYYGSSDNTVGVTDDRGVYRFAGLPDGEYFVRVIEPSVNNEASNSVQSYNVTSYTSGSLLTTFYPNAAEITEAQAIIVTPGQEQGDINITIPNRRLFKISGTVVAKNGQTPLKNLRVTFQKIGDADNESLLVSSYYDQSKQAQTDALGRWSFVDLPKGKYLVRVARTNLYGLATPKTDNQPKFAPVTKEIEIENENLPDIILELPAESSISGTISVEGDKQLSRGVSLTAFNEQSKLSASVSAGNPPDKNKSQPSKTKEPFRLGELSAGKYFLNVFAGDSFYVKSMRAGSIDLLNAPIEIADGEEISNVQIVLASDLGTLKGKINNFSPTEPTFVVLLPTNKTGLSVLTSARQGTPNKAGEFSVQAAPGEYFVVIGTSRNRPKTDKIAEWLKELTAGAPKVTIAANETATVTLSQPNE